MSVWLIRAKTLGTGQLNGPLETYILWHESPIGRQSDLQALCGILLGRSKLLRRSRYEPLKLPDGRSHR